jgi:hypothetical protein
VLYLQQYQLLPYQRTSEAMRDLFACPLSAGTVANIVRECADKLVETELKIKRGVRRSPVIHADETGLRINGRLGYVHVASTPRLTHYAAAAHRGQTAISEINVLPRYRGTCVHDGWLAYSSYTHCRHALCGVHLLRELTYFAELGAETKAWAARLTELLPEMKGEVARVSAAGLRAPLAAGVPEGVGKQGRNLLLRLERRKQEVLRFLTDFSVPFDRYERRSQRQRSPVPPNLAFAFDGPTSRHAGRRRTWPGSWRCLRAFNHPLAHSLNAPCCGLLVASPDRYLRLTPRGGLWFGRA